MFGKKSEGPDLLKVIENIEKNNDLLRERLEEKEEIQIPGYGKMSDELKDAADENDEPNVLKSLYSQIDTINTVVRELGVDVQNLKSDIENNEYLIAVLKNSK